MKLLLLSNSTNPGEEFLEYPFYQMKEFLGESRVKVLFIPFAAVTFSYDDYELLAKRRFLEMGHDLMSIHHSSAMIEDILKAEAVVVGGGNTFHLLKMLQDFHLLDPIRERVISGVPYLGWSAGSNMAGPTISTTNDMPIVETDGLRGFGFVPFQINPHYTDLCLSGHGGETRDQRIQEFLAVNQKKTVMGLWEGTMLRRDDDALRFFGDKGARIFTFAKEPYDLGSQDDFNFLL